MLEAFAARRAQISAVDLGEWHELQLWLASAEHRVFVPFAPDLAHAIPKVAVRLGRDFGAVLGLIEAHALLHQVNRDRDEHGRIVATGTDYQTVRLLVADLISQGLGATVFSDDARDRADRRDPGWGGRGGRREGGPVVGPR